MLSSCNNRCKCTSAIGSKQTRRHLEGNCNLCILRFLQELPNFLQVIFVHGHELNLVLLFDALQYFLRLRAIQEIDSNTTVAESPCSTRSMEIRANCIILYVGHIVVHHHIYSRVINTTRQHIRSHQHGSLILNEKIVRFGPFFRRHTTVENGNSHAPLPHLLSYLLHSILPVGKNNGASKGHILQQISKAIQTILWGFHIHCYVPDCVDRQLVLRDADRFGIVDIPLTKVSNFLGIRSGEQENLRRPQHFHYFD
mmetsp:Transcript_16717/g.41968  ORF Transcript_16717/g.41968 Transcript_16717/m.41968 type:complete len:255 (-) Transcript_16717:118-882(-)